MKRGEASAAKSPRRPARSAPDPPAGGARGRGRFPETQYQALLESAPDAMVVAAGDGRIVIVNAQAEALFGYTRDELIGQPIEVLIPERFRGEHRRKRAEYLADPRVRAMGGGIVVGRRKDRSEFPAEVSLSAVKTEGLLVLSSTADISERKRVEAELRQTTDTLQALVQCSPVGITILDAAGKVMMWNPAAERIFGWTEVEVVGRPLPTIPEGKEREHRSLRETVLRGGTSREVEIRRRAKDGSLLDISLSTAPLRDSTGNVTGVIGMMADISERKRVDDEQRRAEAELRRLTERLLEVQEEERRQVAYDIHDGLGQLLTAASMHLEAFAGHRRALQPPEIESELAKSRRCLSDAVVEMRRMVSEVGPLLLEDVGLFEASRRLLADTAERARWETQFEGPTDGERLDPMLETALYRIVQEALANAAKHARASKVRIAFHLEHDRLALEVRDWGQGFDTRKLPERPERGRNVGLVGMRERAAIAGGEFSLESSPGNGARVLVTVPVARARAAQREAGGRKTEVGKMPEARKREPAGSGIAVLIADDHPMVREGLRAMLDAEGIAVVGEATNGAEAVELAQQTGADVVLMDVRMPDMDGLAATEVIKQSRPETSVIVITSYESKEYLRRAIDAGAAGYLLKGMSRESLIEAVRLVRGGGSLIDARLLSELLKEMGVEGSRFQGVEGALEALTPREQEVLQLLVRGLTNKEIAAEMHYSVGTVKNVVQRVIEKLGVSDRTQAAVYAVRAGMNPPA